MAVQRLSGDANVYAYVRSSPLKLIDPDGLDTTIPSHFRPGHEDPLKKPLERAGAAAVQQWKRFQNWVADKSGQGPDGDSKKRYEESKKSELGPHKPNVWTERTDQIVQETPSVSAGLWLAFAGSLTKVPAPAKAPGFSSAGRAVAVRSAIVDAWNSAAPKMPEIPATFLKEGMVAVARVTIRGEVRVYVGIKVPKGQFGTGAEAFPTKAVAGWLRENVLAKGETLTEVTASDVHADVTVVNAIVRDAKAAGVDPRTVTGQIGAASPVCTGCQGTSATELPAVKIENPAPNTK